MFEIYYRLENIMLVYNANKHCFCLKITQSKKVKQCKNQTGILGALTVLRYLSAPTFSCLLCLLAAMLCSVNMSYETCSIHGTTYMHAYEQSISLTVPLL